MLIIADVEFVFLVEILGAVDWFLWELEFTSGFWDDEPILLFIVFVGAQFAGSVFSDGVMVDVNVGHILGIGVKDEKLIFVFTLGSGNRIQMNQLMSFIQFLHTLNGSRLVLPC